MPGMHCSKARVLPRRLSHVCTAFAMGIVLCVYACLLPAYRFAGVPAHNSAENIRTDALSLAQQAILNMGAEDAQALTAIIEAARAEELIEKELHARGFEKADALVARGSVCIIVHAQPTDEQAAAIFDAAARASGFDPANIRIIPVNAP